MSHPNWGNDTTTDAAGTSSLYLDCCDDPIPLAAHDLDGGNNGGRCAPVALEVSVKVVAEKPCIDMKEQREDIVFELRPVVLAPIDSPR